VRRALCYPLKLIAKNAGVNGSVVTEKVKACLHNFFFLRGSV
jgi:chaperonin GroEL